MDSKDEQFLILEQYRIYSEAKEKFISRQFAANNFYLILNLVILIVSYVIGSMFPQYLLAVLVLSLIGISTTVMWLMGIDSYQLLIKVKYAKVLEYLETKLPEQPYNREFKEYQEIKKNKHLIVFGDVQKILTILIIGVYGIVISFNVVDMVKYQLPILLST